ncbi:5-methylcytosine restriction system specificity protein McrC [Vibrio parahaemolyticus]|uniref:5-methylcytosine restriction system specificity protein McrC n=1 Tax=Vibrio parahaemolyticus TaxID=670 RepID=UPI00387AEEDC
MKGRFKTNHNFYEEAALNEEQLREWFGATKRQTKELIKTLFNGVKEYTTKRETLEHVQIFGFNHKDTVHRQSNTEEEQLILKLYSKQINGEDKYIVQTGLYAGVVYIHNVEISITSAYGDTFLKRMLNSLTHVMLDNTQLSGVSSNQQNEFENIIAYLFVQSLERSAVLGLPQRYQLHHQHSHKVRGKVDVNQYLKRCIPFTGKLTTSYREQQYEQIIVDVLYLSCRTLEKKIDRHFLNKVSGIYQQLAMHFSGRWPSMNDIKQVTQHPSLAHPMYQGYKQTLAYAVLILTEKSAELSKESEHVEVKGYLFDIAQLFEMYLESILSHYLPDWLVLSQQKLTVYQGTFFERNMYPDLVLTHIETGKIMVFDAKFKRMCSDYRDLDRADFYQIHAYMAYYHQQLQVGGLLYPCDRPIEPGQCYANQVMGQAPNSDAHFIVDGVYVNQAMSMSDIIESEVEMVRRIESLVV